MTVTARSVQDGSNRRRHLRMCLNRQRWIDWRICSCGPFELHHHKETGYNDHYPIKQFENLHAWPLRLRRCCQMKPATTSTLMVRTIMLISRGPALVKNPTALSN